MATKFTDHGIQFDNGWWIGLEADRFRLRRRGTLVFDFSEASGTATQNAAQTLAGAITQSGALTTSGLLTVSAGLRLLVEVASSGDTTVVAGDSGTTFVATASSGTQTYTLPAASTSGLFFSFVCGNAGGEILIDPAGTGDNFQCLADDSGAAVTTVAGTGIKNTAASNILGDHITLVADGTSTWYAISQNGVWATQ